MSLIVTGIGRYIGDESAEEKGLIMINKGAIILLVDNSELQKIVPYFKPKAAAPQRELEKEAEESFYLDPTFMTDEEAQQAAGLVDDNQYSEDPADEEGIEAY